jgi:hypothetical protein
MEQLVKAQVFKTIYIMDAGAEVMEAIRENGHAWANSSENLCMTYENALEIPELARVLKRVTQRGCDVIVSN